MRRTNNYLSRDFKKKRSADILSKKRRSKLMSEIRSKNTKFERHFISNLKKATRNEFQTNVASIKGKPDVVFPKDKMCIFLDSDFWHGWQYPRWKHLLKNDFWRDKIESNRKRDLKTTKYLKRNGWKVVRIWEHDLKRNPEKSLNKIIALLS